MQSDCRMWLRLLKRMKRKRKFPMNRGLLEFVGDWVGGKGVGAWSS